MTEPSPYGGVSTKRIRIPALAEAKKRGERWPMLTAYDQYAAEIFDEAGIPVLLVGDSAANNVYGYQTTLQVHLDELIPLVRAVTRATKSMNQRLGAVRLAHTGIGTGDEEVSRHRAGGLAEKRTWHHTRLLSPNRVRNPSCSKPRRSPPTTRPRSTPSWEGIPGGRLRSVRLRTDGPLSGPVRATNQPLPGLI